MQRARQTLGEIDALVNARDIPAALQKITEADAALAKVETVDRDWSSRSYERAWLRLSGGAPVQDTDPRLLSTSTPVSAHAERALTKAPNDANALEARERCITGSGSTT
jgi:hypothetical protein